MGDLIYLCESCMQSKAMHLATWSSDSYRVCGRCAADGKDRGALVTNL